MTMSKVLRALILVGIISTIQGLLEYRCDVLGCNTGDPCDATDHDCGCGGGTFGVPCTANVACHADTSCVAANTITETNNCQTADDTQCICIEGYYGNECQYQRVRATCVASASLKIYVAPYLKAGNDIKVYFAADAATFNGDLSTYDCVQTAIASEGFLRDDLPQSGDAPVGHCEPATLVDGKQEYYVYLQQASPYRTTADQVFKVICDPATDLETTVSTVSELDVSAPVDETSSAVGGIVMKLRKEETAHNLEDIAPGSSVTIGTQLAITFEHQGPIVAYTCVVSAGTGGSEYPLITDACVPQEAEALFWDSVQVSVPNDVTSHGGDPNNHMLKLRIRAFRFQGTAASMAVKCTICKDKACAGGTTTPTCSPDTLLTSAMIAVHADLPDSYRRRRAVTGSGTQTHLTLSINVVDGQAEITRGNDGLANDSIDVGNCYKSTSILLPIILLAVLLLVAMVMTFCFCRRLTNELERKESETNMAYKS